MASDLRQKGARRLVRNLQATKTTKSGFFCYFFMDRSNGEKQYRLVIKDNFNLYVWQTPVTHTNIVTTANCL